MWRGQGYRIDTPGAGRASLCFDLGPGVVSGAMRDISAFLLRQGVSAEVVEDGTIALAEALNNVEEHAYGGRVGSPVVVKLEITPAALRCVIEDRGVPLPEGPLPGACMPKGDPVALETWPEGGFGWAMLRLLAEELQYRRAGDWNRLTFTIRGRAGRDAS